MMVIGNKCESPHRQVNLEQLSELAERRNIVGIEVSVINGEGYDIREAFMRVARELALSHAPT